MSLDRLRERIPDYAKNIRLNLGTLAGEAILSDQQKYGAFLATAHGARNGAVTSSICVASGAAVEAPTTASPSSAATTIAFGDAANAAMYRAS